MTTASNPLAAIHADLTAIAERFSTGSTKGSVCYSKDATVFFTGPDASLVLDRILAARDEILAALPGRKIGVRKVRGFRVWNTFDSYGYSTGKRCGLRVELTDAENDAVAAGWAATESRLRS